MGSKLYGLGEWVKGVENFIYCSMVKPITHYDDDGA